MSTPGYYGYNMVLIITMVIYIIYIYIYHFLCYSLVSFWGESASNWSRGGGAHFGVKGGRPGRGSEIKMCCGAVVLTVRREDGNGMMKS